MEDIYKEVILDHYKSPRNLGKVKGSALSASVGNDVCGDSILITLKLQGNKISDIRFEAKGCAISIASASLLTEYAKQKDISHLRKLDHSFMLSLLGITLTPNRLKCALISLEALQEALQQKT